MQFILPYVPIPTTSGENCGCPYVYKFEGSPIINYILNGKLYGANMYTVGYQDNYQYPRLSSYINKKNQPRGQPVKAPSR